MRGKQRQVGWFPASFVKLKTSRRMSIPDETEPPMPDAQCPGDAPAPDPSAPKGTGRDPSARKGTVLGY